MSSSNSLKKNLLDELYSNLIAAREVRRLALLGQAKFRERIGKLQTGTKSELMREFEKTIKDTQSIKFQKLLKSTLNEHILNKRINSLILSQSIISYAVSFESFINEFIRIIYRYKPQTLKSKNASLTDEDIVDVIVDKREILDVLVDLKVKDLSFESVQKWIEAFKKLGIQIDREDDLREFFLTRNAIIHNGGRVTDIMKVNTRVKLKEGDLIRLTNAKLKKVEAFLYKIALDLHKQALNKHLLSLEVMPKPTS